jgi:hypothetical protein
MLVFVVLAQSTFGRDKQGYGAAIGRQLADALQRLNEDPSLGHLEGISRPSYIFGISQIYLESGSNANALETESDRRMFQGDNGE